VWSGGGRTEAGDCDGVWCLAAAAASAAAARTAAVAAVQPGTAAAEGSAGKVSAPAAQEGGQDPGTSCLASGQSCTSRSGAAAEPEYEAA